VKIIVLGTGYVASGYLAAAHSLGLRPIVLSRDWSDYTRESNLDWVFEGVKPQLVINAAGYTGRSVDDCERNKEECYAANVTAVRLLGKICKKWDVSLIHVSSGCVFTGPGVFTEEDEPNNYGQFYAQTKIAAENELHDSGCRAWIYRIRMPFDTRNHPRNWLFKLLHHRMILDGLNSVTYLHEFAMRSLEMVKEHKGPPGIYHATNRGALRTVDVVDLLIQAGLRDTPAFLWDKEEFEKEHVHRSEAVLDSSKFEEAFRTPFGGALGWVRWAITNWRWSQQYGDNPPQFRFATQNSEPIERWVPWPTSPR